MPVMIYAPQLMSTALPCVPSNILDFPVVGMGRGKEVGGGTGIYIQLFLLGL